MRIAVIAAAAVLATAAGCGSDADEPALDETRTTALSVLTGWDEIYPDASGTAEMSIGEGTRVDLAVADLEPNTDYTAHVHDAACDHEPPGGEHWTADPDEGESEANEIHLAFRTNDRGIGEAFANSDLVADDRARSVVVHTSASDALMEHMSSDRILCGDFDR
ncbi:hypothetical protein L0U85_16290 [Glycomyces sp. L485]|uniref:hypothetical protein n=1 Tax=Glycomyces sp. L485 TaxID=2909235 RepID=UPI001F4A8F76|nr:hypothetical protein [Glycomyces sp. L485]MCH7232399.1 hypothetical protein [Glycomyces sp. L485]